MKPGRTYKLDREPSANPARKPRAHAAKAPRRGGLTDGQKARICIVANQAAKKQGVTGWREVSAWRREQQLQHFGLKSLTAAAQDQYADIKAHFEALAGETGRAFSTALRGQDNDRRIARWHLNKALAAAKLSPAYAQAICKNQFHCTLDEASKKQLWNLVYTVKNRGKAKQIAEEDQAAFPDNCPF